MDTHIPPPVPVAELVAQRRPGRRHPSSGYLSKCEVASAWPLVWDLDPVVKANGVRTQPHYATGTYGTTTWTEYHAGDVQRVADAIADGTAVLEDRWRRDTAEGREAEQEFLESSRRWGVRSRWIQVAILLGVLMCVGLVWFVAARN